jgi:hypothetical protein
MLHLLISHFAAPAIGAICDPKGGSFLGFPTWHQYLDGVGVPSGDPTVPAQCAPRFDELTDVFLIGAALIEIMLRIAALGAIVFVVYGGIQLIISQGDPSATKQARATITNALIGLVVAVSATAVISFIAGRFS